MGMTRSCRALGWATLVLAVCVSIIRPRPPAYAQEPQDAEQAQSQPLGTADEPGELTAEEMQAHLLREEAFNRAVNEYVEHRNIDDWRARVGIDRRLLRAAGKISPEYLAGRLDASPGSLEVATAVAVCLGEGSKTDPPQLVADLIIELLGNPFERVRYRATESIIQRKQDGTMPPEITQRLVTALRMSEKSEKHPLNADSMRYAAKLLQAD